MRAGLARWATAIFSGARSTARNDGEEGGHVRLYGYTIRKDSRFFERFEECGGFKTREARDRAAKESLRIANGQRAPGSERYTLLKWHSGNMTPAANKAQPADSCDRVR